MTLSPDLISNCLKQYPGLNKLLIAYSGGIDSQVLLHLCASIDTIKTKLVAIYIDHALQSASSSWSEHCGSYCKKLGVEFLSIQVNALARKRQSPEEAARNARYHAFKSLMSTETALLVAHHRQDQLETVLLQLFRGSGLRGLSGMPFCTTFGKGILLRPLLDTPKYEIIEYAQTNALQWIEDPSNRQNTYNRNFLRNEVIPLLEQRWPNVDQTVARTARHCADAQQFVDAVCIKSFEKAYDDGQKTLDLTIVAELASRERNWLLRRWFDVLELKPPKEAVLKMLIEQLIYSKPDADPEIVYQNCSFRRYRNKLFCVALREHRLAGNTDIWPEHTDIFSTAGGYHLIRTETSSGISREFWHSAVITVGYRQGGEKIKLPTKTSHRSLKNLYQEAAIPTWQREIRPLVFCNGKLAAISDLWIAEWVWSEQTGGCYQLKWEKAKEGYS